MRLPILLAGALVAVLPVSAQQRFTSLFDGKTLNGWRVCNGQAKYHVEDGAIVGTTAEGSPNSFLCSTREYGDFILELETKVDPALNSGIQLRGHRYSNAAQVTTFDGKAYVQRKHPAGRVYGYQVEIANEKSGTSGGIYDEARRGWLDNIASKPEASKAFKDNQWNKYRIEARGDRIRTLINGVPCADLVDPLDLSGFIALQVHSYKGEKPAQVRWRNIRIQDLGRHTWKPAGFQWSKTGAGEWKIANGEFHASGKPADPRIGYMVGDRVFTDVTARVKFKIAKGNSGFFFRAKRETMAGYEAEIDDTTRTGGIWESGGRRWMTGPEDNTRVKPDDWNELVVSAHGTRIVVHLNGEKTVDLANDAQGSREGVLALQVHGRRETEVSFKDVEILEPAP